MIIFSIISIVVLGVIGYQDFKFRQIHWILFPLLAIILITENVIFNPINQAIIWVSINLGFVIIQVLLMWLYLALTRGTSVSIFKFIGLGDILIFIVMATAFSIVNFIIALTLGLALALIFWSLSKGMLSSKNSLIPLCGILSIFISLIILCDMLFEQFSRYSDILPITLI